MSAVGKLAVLAANVRPESEARVAMAAQTLAEAIWRHIGRVQGDDLDPRTHQALDAARAAMTRLTGEV